MNALLSKQNPSGCSIPTAPYELKSRWNKCGNSGYDLFDLSNALQDMKWPLNL